MPFQVENLPEAIREVKKQLRRELPAYAKVFQEVEGEMRRKVAQIVKEREAGESVVPVLPYSDIAAGSVSTGMIAKIKDRGACVIRNTFAPEQARSWDDEIAEYVEENHLNEKLANAAEDKYFGTLAAAKPQIYGIYWSRPQVAARQAESLTRVRVFSTGCGWPRAKVSVTLIPIKCRCTPIAFAGGHPVLVHSGFPRMWTGDRWNAGLNRISETSTAMSSPANGVNTTHSMPLGGPMFKSFRRRRSVPCFERSKAGLRSPAKARATAPCN